MATSVEKVAKDQFFLQSEMVRFLVAENLAMKSLLHEKGVLTPEEFKAHKERAEVMLNAKVDKHVDEWKKAHPEVVSLFEQADKVTPRSAPQQRQDHAAS